jgi:hypothetical protein
MSKEGFIAILCTLLIGTCIVAISHSKDFSRVGDNIDTLGDKLAEWSYHHQETITINGKAINMAGGAVFSSGVGFCDGSTIVHWQSGEAKEEDNKTIRDNLESIVQGRNCDIEVLLEYINRLNDFDELRRLKAEKLAEDLRCLGQFEFTSVKIE